VPAPPPAASNWQNVQALPAGTSIPVNTKSRSLVCDLEHVDADTLTCTQRKDVVFQRAEIKTIKLARRSRSTGVGVAIGAATGIVIAEAAYNKNWTFSIISRGSIAAIVGVPLAAIGGIVGHQTDFTSSTVYRAP
jgi:hypothetical protein